MSYPFAKGVTLNTKLQVTLNDLCLPHLSHHRTMNVTIKIAPKASGGFGYGMIMGIEMMDDFFGIDQSRTEKVIT